MATEATIMTAVEAYTLGRKHERADIADFLVHPPGRIPDGARRNIEELHRAVTSGTHEGWARRLYEISPPV